MKKKNKLTSHASVVEFQATKKTWKINEGINIKSPFEIWTHFMCFFPNLGIVQKSDYFCAFSSHIFFIQM